MTAQTAAYPADKLRWVTSNVDFLPGLVDQIEAEERRTLRWVSW